MSFDFRYILSASLISAVMVVLPASAQDAAAPKAGTAAEAAATDSAVSASDATQDTTATSSDQAGMAEPKVLDDRFLGEESAPLTIYEYASFTCPHCANFQTEIFPRLKAEYIDTGKVRFAARDVYFDQVGLWAGILARCDEDKFYPISEILMAEQNEWMKAESGEVLVANLRKIGTKAGMTAEQIDACWADEARVADLVTTFQKNASDDDINATPTFMIGGEQVPNMAWEDLKAKIDEKLAEAETTAAATSEAAADAADVEAAEMTGDAAPVPAN
ncbi:MAG: DsbA family protein [Paracoccus sp. (in: a-proteobacteria)]